MRAKAGGILFTGNHHGAAAVVLSSLHLIGGGPPSERGEVESGPVLHDNFRFDPARPVVAGVSVTGDN